MIELSIDGSVATITLNRAPVNAVSDEWIDAFDSVLDQIEECGEVGVVVIRSAQKVFCAGADLAVMKERFATDAGRGRMVELAGKMQRVFARVERLPAVVIAELSGAALGGGMELALACDLRIAGDTVKLGLPEIKLGLLPGAGGTQRLTRVCGEAVARRLILCGEVLTGTAAAELGMVHWAVPRESLRAATDKLVAELAGQSVHAIAECKRCIEYALDEKLDGYQQELDGTARLYANEDSQARVNAFLEKQ